MGTNYPVPGAEGPRTDGILRMRTALVRLCRGRLWTGSQDSDAARRKRLPMRSTVGVFAIHGGQDAEDSEGSLG